MWRSGTFGDFECIARVAGPIMRISVTFTPVEIESRDVSGASVVVIDCFRASTSIVRALDAGATAVYPQLTVEEAFGERRRRPGAVLAGERRGMRVEGFDLGNSPRDFSASTVGGREVIMTTTNGTRLLSAAARAKELYVGGFVNLTATARHVSKGCEEVIFAAAGTQGRFTVEDAICAGLMVKAVCGLGEAEVDDSAGFAVLAAGARWESLKTAVLGGLGGRNVRAAGHEEDLEDCLALDESKTVARVLKGPLRVVREEREAAAVETARAGRGENE